MFRTYDTMAATARRHPEGSLAYVIDQTDLYLRVREGVRQVYVKKLFFILFFILKFAASRFVFLNKCLHNYRLSSWGTISLFLETWVAHFLLLLFRKHKRDVSTCAKNVVFRRTRLLPWNRPRWSFTHQTPTPAAPSLRAPSSLIHIHRYTTNHKTRIPNNQPAQIHTIIQIHGTLPPLTRGIQVTQSA